MDLDNYDFLEEETNELPKENKEDIKELKEQLQQAKETLSDTIIVEEEDLYGQD